MRTLLVIGFVATAALGACSRSKEIPTTTVDEVDSALAKGDCQAVDVNSPITRQKMGVIPHAVLLTDSEEFKLSELPSDKDKALVFYCGGQSCPSSHVAAKRAIAEGYSNVKVMPDGIAGWVSAGKKVATL